MDAFQVKKSELVGRSKLKTAAIEALIRANSLNYTGQLNYNLGGVKDEIGFENVSDKFVDNFLLQVLVPDYNMKDGKNIFIGSQNKTIRELLDAHHLAKCTVKAIVCNRLNTDQPPSEMFLQMPHKFTNKEAENYYIQEFKIGCPNVDYNTVMDFLRSENYNGIGFFLKDIDITIDYAGSFDKYDVIDHLTVMEGFKEEGVFVSAEDITRTIINNDTKVGRNCLSFMENIDGFVTRQKIYNKMVQMLECKSVRSTVGCHWKNWVCQKGTRLSVARDKAAHRGLTRVEVTFYTNSLIPSNDFIDKVLTNIVNYIPKSLVYSTPYSATWKAYCDIFKHSLVCVDRSKDIGVIVNSYNELTQNISGQVIENWSQREKWCLENLTLNGNLPLDVIEVVEISKICIGDEKKKKKKDILLDICGNRYIKIKKDNSTLFTTRLVSKGGVYSCHRKAKKINNDLIEKAGFIKHENCIPYLAPSKGSNTHKTDAELRKIEVLNVNVNPQTKEKTKNKSKIKEILEEKAKHIEVLKKPILQALERKAENIERVRTFKKMFKEAQTIALRDFKQGNYNISVARKHDTRFGVQYKLLSTSGDDTFTFWSNKYISSVLEKAVDNKSLNKDGDFLSINGDNIGILKVTGYGYNLSNHKTIYCQFELNKENGEKEDDTEEQVSKPEFEYNDTIPVIHRENLLPYREYDNLIVLPTNIMHKIESIGYINHYGTERLLVSIGGKLYQGGDDLENKKDKFYNGCCIKIEKIRVNSSRRVKYAVCSIYDKEEWIGLVDYKKTPMLRKFDGTTQILDVKSVDIKGQKRKLLLTKGGEVFKLKKSKLEETIDIGYI